MYCTCIHWFVGSFYYGSELWQSVTFVFDMVVYALAMTLLWPIFWPSSLGVNCCRCYCFEFFTCDIIKTSSRYVPRHRRAAPFAQKCATVRAVNYCRSCKCIRFIGRKIAQLVGMIFFAVAAAVTPRHRQVYSYTTVKWKWLILYMPNALAVCC